MLVHHKATPSIKRASTHLYTWVGRRTVRLKCFAQEHNWARTQTAPPVYERTNSEATNPPTNLAHKKHVVHEA